MSESMANSYGMPAVEIVAVVVLDSVCSRFVDSRFVDSLFVDSQFVDSIKIVPAHISRTAPNVWIAASRE